MALSISNLDFKEEGEVLWLVTQRRPVSIQVVGLSWLGHEVCGSCLRQA